MKEVSKNVQRTATATWNPIRRNGLGAQAYTEYVDLRFRGDHSKYLDGLLWGCGKANKW